MNADDCIRCSHPRYGHAAIGERWVISCPMCWSDASDDDGELIEGTWLATRVSDHDYVAPMAVANT